MTLEALYKIAKKLGGLVINIGQFKYRLVIQNIEPTKSFIKDYIILERN